MPWTLKNGYGPNGPTKEENEKSDKMISVFKVIFIVVFIILPMLTVFWDEEEVKTPCRNTTREVQTITKMDGAVDSVETEIVDGCETPDGTFYQRP